MADFHNWRVDNTPDEYAHLDWTGDDEEKAVQAPGKRQSGGSTVA